MRGIVVILILTLGGFLNGCASLPFASQEDDKKAKSFLVDAGKSNIYVYQIEADEGVNVRMSLDGKVVGKLGQNTFFMWTVQPGSHEITTFSEGISKVTVDAKAGHNNFIWQDVIIGSAPGGRKTVSLKLRQVSNEDGSKGVKESKRVVSKI